MTGYGMLLTMTPFVQDSINSIKPRLKRFEGKSTVNADFLNVLDPFGGLSETENVSMVAMQYLTFALTMI